MASVEFYNALSKDILGEFLLQNVDNRARLYMEVIRLDSEREKMKKVWEEKGYNDN